MARRLTIVEHPGVSNRESLHINLGKREINASIVAFKFVDKDTNQFVVYIPSLEVSGYGETIEKAIEMLNFSADQCFLHLTSLTHTELKKELARLGWSRTIFKKDFSRAYVDANGQLQDMNAVAGSVERLTLQAA